MQIPTYEQLMARVLANVPDSIDKREGSLIWTAVGPVCAELVQAYIELDASLSLAFLDTSSGEYLDRLAAQAGLSRIPAVAAICRAEFFNLQGEKMSIPDGMRFGIQGIFFRRGELIEQGVYQILCETAGPDGNIQSGTLLPVDYLENLGRAEITDLLQPGTEAESDADLRERLLKQAAAPAFGGNLADYREKTLTLEQVGAVKVEAVPEGAGTVGLCILGKDFLPPDSDIIAAVQAVVDPEPAAGKGFAPIGHRVTVRAAASRNIPIEATLTLSDGSAFEQIQTMARDAIENYFLQLRQDWSDNANLVVRISHVAMALLSIDGVLDANVTLDGAAANLELLADEVPVLDELTLSQSKKAVLS